MTDIGRIKLFNAVLGVSDRRPIDDSAPMPAKFIGDGRIHARQIDYAGLAQISIHPIIGNCMCPVKLDMHGTI